MKFFSNEIANREICIKGDSSRFCLYTSNNCFRHFQNVGKVYVKSDFTIISLLLIWVMLQWIGGRHYWPWNSFIGNLFEKKGKSHVSIYYGFHILLTPRIKLPKIVAL